MSAAALAKTAPVPALPPHIAAACEAIPSPGPAPWDGPDMREAMPIDDMLSQLAAFQDDDLGYVMLWKELAATAGLSVVLHHSRDGAISLMVGSPCDPQTRHRSRWLHFLIGDLDAVAGRRETLLRVLDRSREVIDQRPRISGETTRAVRGFLRQGGRLMLDPAGRIEEGGDLGPWLRGTDAEAEACRAANQTYFAMRRRLRADAQIRRVVRALGRRTTNGWIVLEGAKA